MVSIDSFRVRFAKVHRRSGHGSEIKRTLYSGTWRSLGEFAALSADYVKDIKYTHEEAAFGKLFETYMAEERSLIEKLEAWCAEQDLPCMSADELMCEDVINETQYSWLADYVKEWEDSVRRASTVWKANLPHSSSWNMKRLNAWPEHHRIQEATAAKP